MSNPSILSWGLRSAFLALFGLRAAAAEPVTLTVQADKPGPAISPTMFGVFFEDINFGGDGGLYPELVKNRSFEFTEPLLGWRQIERGGKGSLAVLGQAPLNPANPHYLRLKADSPGGGFGISNEGFRGMGVRKGAKYTFSVYARSGEGGPMTLGLELVGADGQKIGESRLSGFTSSWQKHACTVKASATEAKAHLNVWMAGQGTLDLDMVSLFPADTWHHRPNGLRPDLVKLLKDLKPGFVRFPGGCIVEGRYLATRYQWKTTLGDVSQRRLIINRWNDEFKHRPAPDYFQSFGLGFFEYFQLCDDLGAEPLPILNCGMACQFNSGELVPLDQLDPFIQDALDLIEFANGPATSTWGRKRAELGHPAPFNLKFLGVGNEQWGPQYFERYERFAKALKTRHPEIKLVSSAGPGPADDRFQFAWSKLRELPADIVDEHCYAAPDWFFQSATRYDAYDRTGPKVFMGEYAAQSRGVAKPDNRNTWECALAEAAFMTGLERNADVVVMSSYAPLLGHVDAWQWTPNLIWFDNLRSFGTPNYYVQKLFSANCGTRLLPVSWRRSAGNPAQSLFASAARDARSGEVILKMVNAATGPREVRIQLTGARQIRKAARAIVLASSELQAENSLDEPTKVAPVESKLDIASPEFAYTLAPSSLTVLRLGAPGR
jgi:alpha-N-arabinofuranosidase